MSRGSFAGWARRCSGTARTAFAACVITTQSAVAQRISGAVREAGTGTPVSAAVVWLANASDSVLKRVLTDDDGRFTIARAPGAVSAHVVRIGYRPATIALSADTLLNVALARLASQLGSIVTSEQRVCPDDGTHGQGFELWQQARAALLAGVVARETRPPRLRLISSERTLTTDGRVTQRNSKLTEVIADKAYVAGRNPVAFTVYGYLDDGGHERVLYSPDDETLLHPTFLEHHCLTVRDGDNAHRGQVGIAFEPVGDRDTLVDVRGVLWLDREGPALRSLTFSYVGLEPAARPSGGDLRFTTMSNGILVISGWTIRTALLATDVSKYETARRPPPRELRTNVRLTGIREIGGEVALARWPDGTTWTSTAPRITGQLVDLDGRLVSDARVWIVDTPDTVATDGEGRFILPSMPPGPYSILGSDSVLARAGIARTPVTRVFLDDAGNTDIRVPFHPRVDVLERTCAGQRYAPGKGVVLGRVVDSAGARASNARIELWRRIVTKNVELFREEISGEAGEDGRFIICGTARDQLLRVRATRDDASVDTLVDGRVDEVSVVMLTLRRTP